jgi:hypothetical protein
MPERLLKTAFAVALGLAAASGCGEEFSSATATGTGAAGGSTGGSGGDAGGGARCVSPGDPCRDCLVDACPKWACACLANPDCTALYECYAMQCTGGFNDLCAKYCMNLHPDGIADATLVGSCIVGQCSGACSTLPGAPLDTCATCIYEQCSEQMNACLSIADCYDLIDCTAACAPNDGACYSGCIMAHQASQTLLQAVQTCSEQHCAASC